MKGLFKFLIYDVKIFHKLMLSFIIISIPLITLSVLIYSQSAAALFDQATSSANQIFDQTLTSIDNTFKQYDVLTFSLSSLNELSRPDITKYREPNELTAARLSLEHSIYSLVSATENSGVKIFTEGDVLGFYNGQNFSTVEEIQDQKWVVSLLDQFRNNESSFYICPLDSLPGNNIENAIPTKKFERHIGFARAIKDPSNYRESIGIVRIDLSEDFLTRILDQNNLYKNYFSFVQTGDGSLVATGTNTQLNIIRDILPYTDSTAGKWLPVEIQGDAWLVRKEPVSEYNVSLVNVIPEREIYSQLRSIRRTVAMFGLVIAVSTPVIAALIASTMSKRTTRLANTMMTVKQGELRKLPQQMGQDEIGQLSDNYNYMVDKMTQLIATTYQNGKDLKEAELRVLQSQIKPHFLYNTLDMISYFAETNRTQQVQDTISALVKFYRLTLASGQDNVMIEDELDHVTHYVFLQNKRYGDVIELITAIPDRLLKNTVIKTTFQPIVENAIIHGIMCKEEKEGYIRISAYEEGDDIIIRFEDNGVGMTTDQVQKLNQQNKRPKETGYGVFNVDERLRLNYGTSYGLEFKSSPDGTQVYVRIPRSEAS